MVCPLQGSPRPLFVGGRALKPLLIAFSLSLGTLLIGALPGASRSQTVDEILPLARQAPWAAAMFCRIWLFLRYLTTRDKVIGDITESSRAANAQLMAALQDVAASHRLAIQESAKIAEGMRMSVEALKDTITALKR